MAHTDPLPKALLALDQALFEEVRGINILDAIAPENYHQEKAAFFESNYSINPDFAYGEHSIDLFARKRALYNLPVESLPDDDLIQLYSDVIESYVEKLDQFRAIGTDEFVYESLRYFGEPNEKDIRNAQFVLHFPDDLAPLDDRDMGTDEIVNHLTSFADARGYQYDIRLDEKMIANILVSGSTIKVNANARIAETEVHALAHHEVGGHLVTTLNSRNQPVKVLSLGSPVSTTTQEGIAILCEYLAGYLTLPRLKVLALRVIAVQSMLIERDFKRTFLLLKEQHDVDDSTAFTITSRVYRGGGYTKDYLYLQGFHQMLNAYETSEHFNLLLAGKVSLNHLPLIQRLINKGYLLPPKYISPAIATPQPVDEVKRLLAHAIK